MSFKLIDKIKKSNLPAPLKRLDAAASGTLTAPLLHQWWTPSQIASPGRARP